MSYIHGSYYNFQEPGQYDQKAQLTWLDYIIISNPQGVMKVLSGYGYTGYLAPQSEDEMYDVCMELMDKHGDQAVIDILKSHPLYDIISETSTQESKLTFKNAVGDSVIATIKTINYKSLLENALIIIGAFYLAGKLWSFIIRKDVS